MNESGEIAPEVGSILAAARQREAEASEPVSVEARSLAGALEAAEAEGRVPLIAEIKPTSPTTEGQRTDDPVALAEQMVAGGAAALSVLTEPEHFGGSPATLRRVRAAVDVPVLRKDFLLCEDHLDVVEADVVLLIARFLDEPDTDDLSDMLAAARARGFQVLVETHTPEELRLALDAGARFLGVNNRDLARLEVDLGTFEAVAQTARERAGESVTLIAESGLSTREDVARMRRGGADAVLVGSAIMAGDVRARTRELTEPQK